MHMRLFVAVLGIIAVLVISGCAQTSFDCGPMSLGWIESFHDFYGAMPLEAVQCDAAGGSVILVKLEEGISADDMVSKLSENLMDVARTDDLDYYERICSSSDSLCISNLVVQDGKINAAGILDGRLAILAINSDKPGDAQKFLDALWSSRASLAGMLQ